jgi:imidazole glycerol-phosphate synthase subunit HisH
MSDVVIIDSGGANLASLQFALQRLGAASTVSSDITAIRAARRVILPGVGAAADAMQRLRESTLDQALPQLKQPLLGICLGMQLLYTHSDEGNTTCLGIIAGVVKRLTASTELPVPHMGWNNCPALAVDPLLKGIATDDYFYFVHSYAALPGPATLATVDYGQPLTAVVRRDNFCGVQFHPERSARVGAQLLRNFLDS